MGASPSAHADANQRIANIKEELGIPPVSKTEAKQRIANLKVSLERAKGRYQITKSDSDKQEIADLKIKIAEIKAKMAYLPKQMNSLIQDDIVKWELYTRAEPLCVKFPLEQWNKIVEDIHSDADWADFVEHYSDYVICWVLKKKTTNNSIAFIYILSEDECWNTVSIHAGGWGSPIMYYRGYILILQYLLSKGIKVRTYCATSNLAAIRLNRSVGFVPYRYYGDKVYMWINLTRLVSCKFYKRFYDNKRTDK